MAKLFKVDIENEYGVKLDYNKDSKAGCMIWKAIEGAEVIEWGYTLAEIKKNLDSYFSSPKGKIV